MARYALLSPTLTPEEGSYLHEETELVTKDSSAVRSQLQQAYVF